MKKLLFLFVIIFSQTAMAQIPAELSDIKISRENMDLLDNPRYGYFELRDVWGDVIVFYSYEFNPDEKISSFEKGEKFDIAHHKNKGYGIIRHKNQTFLKMIFTGDYDPIKEKQQECLKTANTTGEIMKCYKTSAVEWRTEYLFTYHHLQNTLPEDIAKMVEDTEKELKTLTDSYFKSYKAYLDYLGGSIRYISWARTDADYQEMRFKALLNFYF